MHYELWDAASANVLAVFDSEAEGLGVVRQLLASGWDPEHLSFGIDFDESEDGDDESLPPVLYGAALAKRANEIMIQDSPHRA
jgi:hypothetical protein